MKSPKIIRLMMITATVGALGLGWSASFSWAGEHPTEHPSKKQEKAAVASPVALEDVAKHIEAYVKDHSKDGTYSFTDPIGNKPLSLALSRVHRERLSQIGPDLFFVCADFRGSNGKVYDLDFFVQGTSKETLQVVEDKTSLHKENGKERYTWQYNTQNNLWEQKTIGGTAQEHPKAEHPEHPR